MSSGEDNKVRKRLKTLFSKTFSEKLTIISIILCTFADGLGGSLFQDIVDKKSIRYYFAFSQERRKLIWNNKHGNNM